jgi:hypothetical protein
MLAVDPDLQRVLAVRAIRGNLLRAKWHAAALRFELALRRHDRALKYGYHPDQPRVPAGNPGGGQWTTDPTASGLIRLAGEIPTNDPPEVPKERPKTSPERSAAARLAAKVLGPAATVAEIAKLSTWMVPYATGIISYSDPPRSLEELQDAVSSPEPGYDVHHIVERASALEDGFPMSGVDSRDNLVLIPRMKHWDINSWYQTPNVEYDWQTPREYLSGRNWDVRRAVGLDALKDAGVLKR